MIVPDKVKILRGKYKGFDGYMLCYTEPHHLSGGKRRAQIRVFGFGNHRTLLMHDDGYEVINYKSL